MTGTPLHKPFLEYEKTSSLVMHILVVVMVGCLGMGIYMVSNRAVPEWSGSYLPWLCIFVCLEAILSHRVMHRQADLVVSPLVYRGIELIVMLIIIKLVQHIWHGAESIWKVIPTWRTDFLNNFLTGEYVVVVIIALLVWIFGVQSASDLDELKGDVIILKDSDRELPQTNRSDIHRHLSLRVFIMGFILVVLTALASFSWLPFVDTPPHPSSTGLLILVIYFIAGFSLIGQANFVVLRGGWAREHISVGPGMAQRWISFSLLFLTLVTLIAFLLPTRYSLGLLSTLRAVLNIVALAFIKILSYIFAILSVPFVLLINFVQNLFGDLGSQSPVTTPPPPRQLVENIQQAPVEWVSLLKSIFFWIIFLGVVGYALIQYFRQNQQLFSGLRKSQFWSWMVRTWKRLLSGIDQANRNVVGAIQAGLERIRSRRSQLSTEPVQRYLSLRRLPPLQKVFFYYLALLRRCGESSLPRKPAQTPYEYAHYLALKIPEAHQDVDDLTEMFMKARYTTQEITSQDAGFARIYWEKIRKFLRDFSDGREHTR